jgi:hypothetical protein
MMVLNWPKHVVLLILFKTPCNRDWACVVFDGFIEQAKKKVVNFTQKINTINLIYKLCGNSNRHHQRSWSSFLYYFLFSVTQNVETPTTYWSRKRLFLAPESWRIEQIRDEHRVTLHNPLLFPHVELDWNLAVRYQGDATNHNKTEFYVVICRIKSLLQVQWILIVPSRCKLNSLRGLHKNYQNACA